MARVSVSFTEGHYMIEGKGQTRNWLIIASLSTQVSLFDLFRGSLKEIVQYDVALK